MLRHRLEATVAPSFLAGRATHRVIPPPLLVTSAARSTRIEGHMTTLYLDLETYSPVPITHGTHRYAEEAEILLVALAVDDAPVDV